MEIIHIKRIFASIGNNIPRDDNEKAYKAIEDQIKLEIEFLSTNKEHLKELIPSLFIKLERTPKNILHLMEELAAHLFFNPYSYQLIANVFLEISNEMGTDNAESILRELKENNDLRIFGIIHSLPIIFSEHKFSASFTADWFYIIGEKIKADLASGDFFKALDNQAYFFPEEAVKALEIYMKRKFTGLQLVLGSIILGSIRAANRNKNLYININEIEKELLGSHLEDFRIVYYRSWLTTFSRKGSHIEETMKIIKLSYEGTLKEQEESFIISSRVLINDINDNNSFNHILDWYNNVVNDKIPAEGKFHIINLIYWIATFDNNEQLVSKLNVFKPVFKRLLPIEDKYVGTWKKIEELFTSLIRRTDDQLFKDYFEIVVNYSSESFSELLSKDHFRSLEHYFIGQLGDRTFTKLLFSEKETERSIAFELYRKMKNISLIDLDYKPSEKILEKIFLEFSRNILLADGTSGFLLMIEPFYRKVNEELKSEFVRELVFQAINYPGACLEKWKKVSAGSDIFKEVVDKAEKYFKNMHDAKDLPGRSFINYEFVEGAKLENKIRSRILRKDVKERSIFLSLFKSTQILYGDRWSIRGDVRSDDPQKFKELSHTVEIPRIENIDPEGMVLKRLSINSRLNNDK
jgi:hypothetical protein